MLDSLSLLKERIQPILILAVGLEAVLVGLNHLLKDASAVFTYYIFSIRKTFALG